MTCASRNAAMREQVEGKAARAGSRLRPSERRGASPASTSPHPRCGTPLRERSLDGRVSFVVGDLERLPLPAASADAVISNGAFCLAPNKPKAFAEVWRVLRPGGRFAIATSVVLRPLEEGKWPLCMRMFSELSSLQPIATKALSLIHI